MKKKLDAIGIANELSGRSAFFRKEPTRATPEVTGISTREREESRENTRDWPRELPTRDEIQEFSFRLRDVLKVKVQAEVPHQWQAELEDMARALRVKKLELYRFMIGEFLGKVKRRGSNGQ